MQAAWQPRAALLAPAEPAAVVRALLALVRRVAPHRCEWVSALAWTELLAGDAADAELPVEDLRSTGGFSDRVQLSRPAWQLLRTFVIGQMPEHGLAYLLLRELAAVLGVEHPLSEIVAQHLIAPTQRAAACRALDADQFPVRNGLVEVDGARPLGRVRCAAELLAFARGLRPPGVMAPGAQWIVEAADEDDAVRELRAQLEVRRVVRSPGPDLATTARCMVAASGRPALISGPDVSAAIRTAALEGVTVVMTAGAAGTIDRALAGSDVVLGLVDTPG